MGTYFVVGRFAEGAGLTQPSIALVTSGQGTTNQALSPLGAFSVLSLGWASWEWATLADANGKPVKVTFDGSPATLRYIGSALPGQPELNTGFFMLVPTIPDLKLKATASAGNITISFPPQTGYNYQVWYKDSLSATGWTKLGSPIPGNGALRSATDSAGGNGRFYRVEEAQ